MKQLRRRIVALALSVPLAAFAHEKGSAELLGHFESLDRSVPSCGIFFVGSIATFVTAIDLKKVELVVPCAEMQKVKSDSGHTAPIELHKTYRIVVSRVRPKNMGYPAASPELLYLIGITESSSSALQ